MKKVLFILLTALVNTCYSQLIGWPFEQVIKLKGLDFKKENTYTSDGTEIYFLKYKKNLVIDGPQEFANYTETFVFKKNTNRVYSYNFIGLKKESELALIIESNNQKFKPIDKGSTQSDFEWHDEKNNTIYILSVKSDIGNEYKFVTYMAMGQ